MVTQSCLELVNVALAGSEDQNVTRAALMGGMDDQLGTGSGHRCGHVGDAVVGVIGIAASAGMIGIGFGDGARQLVIVGVSGAGAGRKARHLTHQCGCGAERFVHHLHREGAAGHLDHWYFLVQCVREMILELHRIDGCGGDDELQVATLGEQGR